MWKLGQKVIGVTCYYVSQVDILITEHVYVVICNTFASLFFRCYLPGSEVRQCPTRSGWTYKANRLWYV